MAKYTRFDPRNKKRNKHKNRVKFGLNEKKQHDVGPKRERYYYPSQEAIPA